jgi:hypothetical protein
MKSRDSLKAIHRNDFWYFQRPQLGLEIVNARSRQSCHSKIGGLLASGEKISTKLTGFAYQFGPATRTQPPQNLSSALFTDVERPVRFESAPSSFAEQGPIRLAPALLDWLGPKLN